MTIEYIRSSKIDRLENEYLVTISNYFVRDIQKIMIQKQIKIGPNI